MSKKDLEVAREVTKQEREKTKRAKIAAVATPVTALIVAAPKIAETAKTMLGFERDEEGEQF